MSIVRFVSSSVQRNTSRRKWRFLIRARIDTRSRVCPSQTTAHTRTSTPFLPASTRARRRCTPYARWTRQRRSRLLTWRRQTHRIRRTRAKHPCSHLPPQRRCSHRLSRSSIPLNRVRSSRCVRILLLLLRPHLPHVIRR